MNNSKKDKKQLENTAPEETKSTIMPTMIDESEEYIEKKRDLSAIIPHFEEGTTTAENSIELISKDNTLKSDGSISIATLTNEGEVNLSPNARYPEQIDVEERKKEQQRRKNRKTEKLKKKKSSASAQKFQNRMAIVSLITIIFICGFAYWVTHRKTEMDFQPLVVTVELGKSLPYKTSSYVKPGVGNNVDDLLYAVDLSNVIVEEPGEYPFTVTYKGTKKQGKIIVQDTTSPTLEIRNVTIVEGQTYDASTFVEDCRDLSGCNYSFQDSDTEQKYTTAGSYVVYVVATDAFQNTTTKKASLIIESQGNVHVYTKHTGFDWDLGYEKEETYDLHFAQYRDYALLVNGTYEVKMIYQDAERYNKEKEKLTGEANYSFNDAEMTITQITSTTIVGSNYSKYEDIDPYLKREGFTEIG